MARVGSTNDAALALAARGAPEGTVVVAALQSAGRGRRGRVWQSPTGGNLYASIVLRPLRPQREWPRLSWAVAGAVAAAAAGAGAAPVGLKPPNDVLVGERKLAGVLLETRSAPGRPGAVVAGFGVNLASAPSSVPGGLRMPAVCLEEATGEPCGSAAFLAAVCAELERLYGAWEDGGDGRLLDAIASRGVGVGALRGGTAPGGLEERAEAEG